MMLLPSTAKLLAAMVLVGVVGGVVEATMDEGTGFLLGMFCAGVFAIWLHAALTRRAGRDG